LSTEIHLIPKRPQCTCCGDPTLMQKPLPLLLGSRKKKFTADGGHRYCVPEETLRKNKHHISSITGIIRELQKVSLADANDLVHTYVAKHHFTTMFDDLDDLRINIGGRSVGKGKTDLQAKVSALGEAIERYSSVFQGDEPRERGNYGKFGDRAIHPNTCMNYSQEQYNTREEWNTSHPNSKFQKVPEPFDEEEERDWTPVWSLTDGEFKYLPTAYCYPGYPKPPQADCWSNSNGSAAGNTIEEAILQGFMELVERDCVALWWYNRIKRPEVNLDSFDETYFSALKNYYQKLNRDLWVIDITNDFNIPTFAAISRRIDRQEKEEDIIYGFAAHFDSKLAIGRALTEVNQNLSNVQAANADGSTRYPIYSDFFALEWWKTATLENQPYLVPDESMAPKVWDDYPQEWSDDLLEDITICQQLVEKKGMEMLVLDQTRPDIGLKVVKVIVPGMRHFWRRFGAGRLYEIPVQLGWLKEPLPEKQLNPFPIWW
ncbi:MAG: TOMM precursor leader peptide-binding protein, partial [Okeania sp. SIO2F4]|uniref:TOMM precursor leader peptide-binding protein n=1 Tax=Okeania sp. SIO2F4 TaxID=2607790 RepID=UPI001428E803